MTKNIRTVKSAFKILNKKVVVEEMIVNDGFLAGCLVVDVFNTYINSVTSFITNSNVRLYADDTVLYCCAKPARKAFTTLQQAFNKMQDFLVNLKLVLNASKTKFMIFS